MKKFFAMMFVMIVSVPAMADGHHHGGVPGFRPSPVGFGGNLGRVECHPEYRGGNRHNDTGALLGCFVAGALIGGLMSQPGTTFYQSPGYPMSTTTVVVQDGYGYQRQLEAERYNYQRQLEVERYNYQIQLERQREEERYNRELQRQADRYNREARRQAEWYNAEQELRAGRRYQLQQEQALKVYTEQQCQPEHHASGQDLVAQEQARRSANRVPADRRPPVMPTEPAYRGR